MLQLQAGHAPELNVEHEAVHWRVRRRAQEGLARGVGVDLKSRRAKQTSERAGKAVIIIDDRNSKFAFFHPG
jgi:DNA-binding Lrp family transcriptional regulator